MKCFAAEHAGAFTRQQALVDYSPGEVRTLLAHGAWVRIFRGVYKDAATPDSAALAIHAATLAMGTSVAACRGTAARLHRFDVLAEANVHVLAATPRMTRVSSLIVHRDEVDAADLVVVDGVPATTRERTAIDLARRYTRMDALAVLDRAMRRGVRREDLEIELAKHRGKRGVRQAIELVSHASPRAESPMESRMRLRCIDSPLPTAEPQWIVAPCTRFERRIDLAWPKWRIGLEYESGEWHTGEAALSRDNPRHNWLITEGWTMFYATAGMVYRRPEEFIGPIGRLMTETVSA